MRLFLSLATLRQSSLRALACIPFRARYQCNICDKKVQRFLPYRGGWNDVPPLSRSLKVIGSDVENFECPSCGSHDRERHLRMYLTAAGIFPRMKGARILHLAPERHLQRLIRETQPDEYILGDLHPNQPGVEEINLEAVPYPDNHFDFVLVNHVLEHVESDTQALREIFRVLRPGGHAILQTPYSNILTQTFEDPAIFTQAACLHAYGQEDHRRLYGRDIVQRFELSGLTSLVQDHFELLPEVDHKKFGVNSLEPFLIFEKKSTGHYSSSIQKSTSLRCIPAIQNLDGSVPLLSILCLTYNHEKYIAQALDSFLMQEVGFSLEIVVGDDCSTDNTLQILEEYRDRFPNQINLLTSQFNLGVTGNFRRTLKECRGRYIAICEGDDFWEDREKLQMQVEFLEKNKNYVITYHDAYILDVSGEKNMIQLPVEYQCDASQDELINSRPISTLTVCFRNVLGELPVEFNHAPVLDLCLWSLLGQHGEGKYLGEIKPSAYRVHEGGIFSTQNLNNKIRMTARSYLCLAQFYRSNRSSKVSQNFTLRAASMVAEELDTLAHIKLIINLIGQVRRLIFNKS